MHYILTRDMGYMLVTHIFLGVIYLVSKHSDNQVRIFHQISELSFDGGRIINSGKEIYKRKELVFSRKVRKLDNRVNDLHQRFDDLSKSLKRIEDLQKEDNKKSTEVPDQKTSNDMKLPQNVNNSTHVTRTVTNTTYSSNSSNPNGIKYLSQKRYKKRLKRIKKYRKGPAVISFPVQSKKKSKIMTVKLPAGSFVRAKLLTGVEAPEGKALPILMQADYAFIGPNKTRIDLTGCFLIAKSTGNLSIERVEMQTTKISCVSKTGRMFERKMNGFIADGKDNSFAVIGSVNSKQDRVAAMAFLSSIVEGIGKAVAQAQITSQTGGLGGSSSILSGDQGKYIAAGGVGNAASQVTQWYLKHAQNLLPTINIGSGKDVWIVVQNTVDLPNWYFRKEKSHTKKSYLYMSRILDN